MKNERELLTDYIHDVLYDPEKAQIEIAALNEEYRCLGESLKQLGEWVIQANRLAGELASGKITAGENTAEENTAGENAAEENTAEEQKDGTWLDEENVFAKNIRDIQRVLEYRTRQIRKIFRRNQEPGSQGEPDRGFDEMVHELRKRTAALENERNLFIQFTESASERIVVLDEENGEMLFANKVAREFRKQTAGYIDEAESLNAKSGCTSENPYSEWLHTVTYPDEEGHRIIEHFQVHSIYIIWENRGAIAHMFSDVTEMQKLHDLAMKDALTGAFSRSYAMEYLDRIFQEGRKFTIAFVDVDYLKYCNDTFGHSAGDAYLLQVVKMIQRLGEDRVVCRTGGDEFLVISETLNGEELSKELEHTRQILGKERFKEDGEIHKSFSYGIAARRGDEKEVLQELLSLADERMYQDKLQNKRKNHLAILDDRLF